MNTDNGGIVTSGAIPKPDIVVGRGEALEEGDVEDLFGEGAGRVQDAGYAEHHAEREWGVEGAEAVGTHSSTERGV